MRYLFKIYLGIFLYTTMIFFSYADELGNFTLKCKMNRYNIANELTRYTPYNLETVKSLIPPNYILHLTPNGGRYEKYEIQVTKKTKDKIYFNYIAADKSYLHTYLSFRPWKHVYFKKTKKLNVSFFMQNESLNIWGDCKISGTNKDILIASNSKTDKSSKELKKEKLKSLEEERIRKALEQRIAELEKKNKELEQSNKEQKANPKSNSGSGFFISKLGHIITNEHVIKKCDKITVGDNVDRQVPAKLIEVDRKNDLALLRTTTLDLASSETKSLIKKLSTQKLGIEIVPLATAGLMRSNDVELGEEIVVAGFPYGDIFSKDIKVTFGNVNSTKGVGDDSSQFQIQAPVQIGNSGGPIYDKYGNIVGVVVAQLDKLKMAKTIGSLPENVNFGIKASTVKQFLNSSGLPTKWAEKNKVMSNKEIPKIASKQTVMVLCNR